MKKTGTIVILVSIVLLFSIAMFWLWQKNAEDPIVYESQSPTIDNIVKKTVATGSIVPKEEVLIKPNISGIIDEIFVESLIELHNSVTRSVRRGLIYHKITKD